jgi:hydrogenase maturation protease
VTSEGRRIGVLGLGNVLMGDDALGPFVIATLQARYRFDERVRVEDLGTPGLDLRPHLAELEAVILIDTVRAEGRPGELRCYRREEILRHPPPQRIGPHDPGVKETLLALEFAGTGPSEVLLVGVIPERVQQQERLTPVLREAVSAVIEEVLDELARLGAAARARDEPLEPDLWWERPESQA